MTDIRVAFELLDGTHDLAAFSCGDDSLDAWLRDRALRNQKLDATRTFVALEEGTRRIMGYYGLSMGEIVRSDAPKPAQRNMPASIPVILLGRLAISIEFQGQGLGRFLMRHALETSLRAAENVAARLMITVPIDEQARRFYLAVGFEPLAGRDDALCIDLKKLGALP